MASGAQLASKDFIERVRDALIALSEGSSASPVGELASISSVGKKYALISMAANQSANFTPPDHVELDQVEFENSEGSGVSVTGGANTQADGIITLPKGGIWKLNAWLTFQGGAAADQICCAFFGVSGSGFPTPAEADGKGLMQKNYTNINNAGLNSVPATAYIDARLGAVDVELRILSGAGVQVIFAGSTNEGPTYVTAEQL